MGNIDFVEEWLDFQSHDVFQGTIQQMQKWVDTCNVVDKKLELDDPLYDDLAYASEQDIGIDTRDQFNNQEVLLDTCDLEANLRDMNLHQAVYREDVNNKENNFQDNRSQTSLNTGRKTRDQNSLRSIRNGNMNISGGKIGCDAPDSSSIGTGKFILDDLPDFKLRPYVSLEESLCIKPEVLNKTDGEVTYYKDAQMIPDKTWLPRRFQHHRVPKNLFQGCDPIFYYHRNPKCPKSSGSEASNLKQSGFLENLSTYRYSRKSKFSRKIEVMCRLCRGQNWVLKSKFNHHMAFSHGVLIPYNENGSGLSLISSPMSLYTSKDRKFVNFFVKCPTCEKWIKLGLGENARNNGKSTNGLYHNYFLHYLKNHKPAS